MNDWKRKAIALVLYFVICLIATAYVAWSLR